MAYRDEVYFESDVENESPFTQEEYDSRLTGLRRRMAAAGIDLLYLMAPESMYYLSGYQNVWYQAQSPQQWPAGSAIAIHVDHDHFIRFDSEREAICGRIFTRSSDVRFFPRTALRGSTGFVIDELRAAGWLTGTVGMEFWSYRPNRMIGAELQAAFEGAGRPVVDGTELLRDQRWVKSPAEVDCLREAARIADVGMAAARAAMRPGVMELEIYGEMIRAMGAAGGEHPGNVMPVLSGRKTNALHGVATRRTLKPGEMVLVDLCGVFKRYHVNLARSFVVGEPSPDLAAAAAKVSASVDVIKGLLKPGLNVGEFNRTMKAWYEDQGIWDDRGWIGGYEMGIAFPPDWVGKFIYDPLSETNADRSFEAGTCVNYENQFFMPRHQGQYFGIDSFLFTADDARILSAHPNVLTVVG
ncbi:M24 family metallopeptidase [Zavarzinia sp. CC-PAN008]|uniref:M24 family metallopeptidase n=1 Tax=Zavarzinia sp. CC-PAN008 TaxID=3243332 RepID=UPI003F74857F